MAAGEALCHPGGVECAHRLRGDSLARRGFKGVAWEIPGSGPGLGYPAGLDPFESIPNPAFYVPRAAAERALLDLEEAQERLKLFRALEESG